MERPKLLCRGQNASSGVRKLRATVRRIAARRELSREGCAMALINPSEQSAEKAVLVGWGNRMSVLIDSAEEPKSHAHP